MPPALSKLDKFVRLADIFTAASMFALGTALPAVVVANSHSPKEKIAACIGGVIACGLAVWKLKISSDTIKVRTEGNKILQQEHEGPSTPEFQ